MMSRRKIFLITIVITSSILLASIILAQLAPKSKEGEKPPDTTKQDNEIDTSSTFPEPSGNINLPIVIASSPHNESYNVSPYTDIEVTFNKTVNPDVISVEIYPPLPTTKIITGKTLTLSYKKPLAAGTQYEILLLDKNTQYKFGFFSFTTEGTRTEDYPDTKTPDDVLDDIENYEKQNEPDVYLANRSPFENEFFTIQAQYKSEGSGHFGFFVKLKTTDKENDKEQFINWMISLGFTQNQIDNLDITYN